MRTTVTMDLINFLVVQQKFDPFKLLSFKSRIALARNIIENKKIVLTMSVKWSENVIMKFLELYQRYEI